MSKQKIRFFILCVCVYLERYILLNVENYRKNYELIEKHMRKHAQGKTKHVLQKQSIKTQILNTSLLNALTASILHCYRTSFLSSRTIFSVFLPQNSTSILSSVGKMADVLFPRDITPTLIG